MQTFDEKSMEFQKKMVANGGLGEETYLPPGGLLVQCHQEGVWTGVHAGLAQCAAEGTRGQQQQRGRQSAGFGHHPATPARQLV